MLGRCDQCASMAPQDYVVVAKSTTAPNAASTLLEYGPPIPATHNGLSLQDVVNCVQQQENNFRAESTNLRSLVQKQHETVMEKINEVLNAWQGSPPLAVQTFTQIQMEKPKELGQVVQSGNNIPATGQLKHSRTFEAHSTEAARRTSVINACKATRKAERQAIQKVSQVHDEDAAPLAVQNCLTRLVTSNGFEGLMGLIVFVNMCETAVHLQWQGYDSGHRVGLQPTNSNYPDAKFWFDFLEYVFNTIYMVELLLRIYARRLAFFHSYFNFFDALVVTVTWTDSFVLPYIEEHATFPSLASLRMMRVFRVFRIGRMSHSLHTTQRLREMRVLVQTLVASIRGLIWSVVMVGVIVLAMSLVVTQISRNYVLDDSLDIEVRKEVYLAFGTTIRSSYSIFVCTFTTAWHRYASPLIENVGVSFALFFVPFVVCVNFAVMRVVSALFLKQTMQMADLERAQEELLEQQAKESVADQLKGIFVDADTSGDGVLSQLEFYDMLGKDEVMHRLQNLGVEVDEAVALFGVLSSDDGEADYEEFLTSALCLNLGARRIDSLQILHQVLELHKRIDRVVSFLQPSAPPPNMGEEPIVKTGVVGSSIPMALNDASSIKNNTSKLPAADFRDISGPPAENYQRLSGIGAADF